MTTGLPLLLCFGVFLPALALISAIVLRRAGATSSLDVMFSSHRVSYRCLRALWFALLATILSVGITFHSLNADWQYAPADLDTPVSWLCVLIPAAVGAMLGSLWVGWVYRALALTPNEKMMK